MEESSLKEVLESLLLVQKTATDQYTEIVKELRSTIHILNGVLDSSDQQTEQITVAIEEMEQKLSTNILEILNAVVNMLAELTALSGTISRKVDELRGTSALTDPAPEDQLFTIAQYKLIQGFAHLHTLVTGESPDVFYNLFSKHTINTVGSGRKVSERFTRWQKEKFFSSFLLKFAEKHNYPDGAIAVLLSMLLVYVALMTKTPVFHGTGISNVVETFLRKEAQKRAQKTDSDDMDAQ